MADAAARSGRSADAVRLMAVTKTLPAETVSAAIQEGLSLFGENRVQEAAEKYTRLPGKWELHLIGHLQRNKARDAANFFTCVQSIDKAETAEALSRARPEGADPLDVLLEMNTSGEESKHGVRSRDELLKCMEAVMALPGLRVRGLMTVGPLTEDRGAVRRAFAALSSLFHEVNGQGVPGFDTLSMGMSGDFEEAIEEGATLVRIGSALFGSRNRP